jgi:hypothetical protein
MTMCFSVLASPSTKSIAIALLCISLCCAATTPCNVLRDGSWGFRRDGNPQDAVLRDGNDRAYSQEASRDSAIQMHDRNLPPSLCLASKPPYFSTLPSSAIGSDFSLTVENLPLKGEENPTTSSGKSRPKSHNTNIKTTP